MLDIKNMRKLAILLVTIFFFTQVHAYAAAGPFRAFLQSLSKFFNGNVTKTVDEGITLSDDALRNIGQKSKKNTDETISGKEILQEGTQEASSALNDD
tara:strand:+ start:12 stop:305 length:294 start_codon:yes stop_codon:yes gene_type:complete